MNVSLDDPAAIGAALEALLGGIKAGSVTAVAVVVAHADGALEPWWAAAKGLGPHAGSVLRGAVAYLGARMDAAALAPVDQPIAFGGGEDTWTP